MFSIKNIWYVSYREVCLCSTGFCSYRVKTSKFCTITNTFEKKDSLFLSHIFTHSVNATYILLAFKPTFHLDNANGDYHAQNCTSAHLYANASSYLQILHWDHFNASLNSRCYEICLYTCQLKKRVIFFFKVSFRYSKTSSEFLSAYIMSYAIRDKLLTFLKFKFMSIFTKHDMSIVSYPQMKRMILIFYSLCLVLLGI